MIFWLLFRMRRSRENSEKNARPLGLRWLGQTREIQALLTRSWRECSNWWHGITRGDEYTVITKRHLMISFGKLMDHLKNGENDRFFFFFNQRKYDCKIYLRLKDRKLHSIVNIWVRPVHRERRTTILFMNDILFEAQNFLDFEQRVRKIPLSSAVFKNNGVK